MSGCNVKCARCVCGLPRSRRILPLGAQEDSTAQTIKLNINVHQPSGAKEEANRNGSTATRPYPLQRHDIRPQRNVSPQLTLSLGGEFPLPVRNWQSEWAAICYAYPTYEPYVQRRHAAYQVYHESRIRSSHWHPHQGYHRQSPRLEWCHTEKR